MIAKPLSPRNRIMEYDDNFNNINGNSNGNSNSNSSNKSPHLQLKIPVNEKRDFHNDTDDDASPKFFDTVSTPVTWQDNSNSNSNSNNDIDIDINKKKNTILKRHHPHHPHHKKTVIKHKINDENNDEEIMLEVVTKKKPVFKSPKQKSFKQSKLKFNELDKEVTESLKQDRDRINKEHQDLRLEKQALHNALHRQKTIKLELEKLSTFDDEKDDNNNNNINDNNNNNNNIIEGNDNSSNNNHNHNHNHNHNNNININTEDRDLESEETLKREVESLIESTRSLELQKLKLQDEMMVLKTHRGERERHVDHGDLIIKDFEDDNKAESGIGDLNNIDNVEEKMIMDDGGYSQHHNGYPIDDNKFITANNNNTYSDLVSIRVTDPEKDSKAEHIPPHLIGPPPSSGIQPVTTTTTSTTVTQARKRKIDYTLPSTLWDGGYLWKYPYTSNAHPHRRWFNVKHLTKSGRSNKGENDDKPPKVFYPFTLIWMKPENEKKTTHELCLHDVTEIRRGHTTAAFWTQVANQGRNSLPIPDLCFSLISIDRTLDLAANSLEEADIWFEALTSMLDEIQGNKHEVEEDTELEGKNQQKSIYETVPEIGDVFTAVRAGNVMDLARLYDSGMPVDIMESTKAKDTALMLACRLGHSDIVQLCLARGAKNDPHPSFGQTAVQAAVSAGHTGCVKQILDIAAESGADVQIVNHEDPNGESPLHVAARCGNIELVELLTEHGAQMQSLDMTHGTCVHSAAIGGRKECLLYFLDAGGDVFLDSQDMSGNTPLHCAAKHGHIKCVKLLLETAADTKAVNKNGQTPSKLALSQGNHQIVKILYEYNKELEALEDELSSIASSRVSLTSTSSNKKKKKNSKSLERRPSITESIKDQVKKLDPFGVLTGDNKSLPRPNQTLTKPKKGSIKIVSNSDSNDDNNNNNNSNSNNRSRQRSESSDEQYIRDTQQYSDRSQDSDRSRNSSHSYSQKKSIQKSPQPTQQHQQQFYNQQIHTPPKYGQKLIPQSQSQSQSPSIAREQPRFFQGLEVRSNSSPNKHHQHAMTYTSPSPSSTGSYSPQQRSGGHIQIQQQAHTHHYSQPVSSSSSNNYYDSIPSNAYSPHHNYHHSHSHHQQQHSSNSLQHQHQHQHQSQSSQNYIHQQSQAQQAMPSRVIHQHIRTNSSGSIGSRGSHRSYSSDGSSRAQGYRYNTNGSDYYENRPSSRGAHQIQQQQQYHQHQYQQQQYQDHQDYNNNNYHHHSNSNNGISREIPPRSPYSTHHTSSDEFYTNDSVRWKIQYTEEGHIYYEDLSTGETQWEDPRQGYTKDPHIIHHRAPVGGM